MSMAGVSRQPRVVLETATGTTYDIPVYDLEGRPGPINLTPIDPFDQVSIVGDTARALDRRADQIIAPDQTGGAGRDAYVETEGVTDYRQSDADPRVPGTIVCRPRADPLAGTLPDTGLEPWRIHYAGYTSATRHCIAWGSRGYRQDGGAYTVFAGDGGLGVYGYVRALGYTFILNNTGQLRRTSDGVTFAASGTLPAAVGAGSAVGLALHDGKLWTVWKSTARQTMELYQWQSPAATVVPDAVLAGSTSWVAGTETITELVVWKDGAGSPALAILTSQRLLMYNPVGQTIEEYDDFSANNPDGATTDVGITAMVFKTTGDLFVAQGIHNDYLMRYTPGAGFGKVTPNRYGGLSEDRQGSPRVMAQNAYGLGVWTTPTTVVGGAAYGGAAWFVNPEGGWHCLHRNNDPGELMPATAYVNGGGIGGGEFYTVYRDSATGLNTVYVQDVPNVSARPQFAVGRRYDVSDQQYHEYARTDFGSPGTRFALLGFTLVSLLSDGSDQYGMDATARYEVEYAINGGAWTKVTQYKDINGVFRSLFGGKEVRSSLTDIGFPVRLVVNNEFGVVGYDLKWRVLLRTISSDDTPVLVYCAPRAKKVPPQHYAYEFVVDVMDFVNQSGAAPGGALAAPFGRSAHGVHDALSLLDALGTMVKLTFGAAGQQATDMCEFAMAPQLHPMAGVGRYRVSLRSVAADPSG